MADLTVIDQAPRPFVKPIASPIDAGVQQLRALLARPAVQRAAPLAALAGIVAALLLGWSVLTAAPQRDLMPGMAESDKAAVAQALDAAAVPYRIDASTGGLRVSGDDYHRARMLLAAQGLPRSPPAATQALDAMPLGASEAVERERLLGAREGDLARTIEAIDAVGGARVHLAVEPPSLFVRDRHPARASVMVTLRPGRTLAEGQVAAIANLVSSSVPGLTADGVAIVDQAGHLLTTEGGQSAALAGQLALQTRIEDRYNQAIAAVLTPVVGADAFSAQVHVDLDWAATDATRESFPEASRAIASEDQRWTAEAPTPPAVGIPGALSNTAPPASTVSTTAPTPLANAAAPMTGVRSQDTSRRFELGREVSVTRGSAGSIRRLSLAVALRELPGKRRSPAELAAIEALVRGAVGADGQRGDVVTVSARPFTTSAEPTAPWYAAAWIMPVAKGLGLVIAALLGWFLVGRKLIKRFDAATDAMRRPDTAALLETALGSTGTTGTPGAAPVTLEMIEAAPGYADRAALVRDYVRQDPARAAQVLRAMIRTDRLEITHG